VGRVTTEVTRKTRSDALENRDHVVRVARAVFAAEGLAVTMRELARRAGLGIATLYRHFPTREDLILAAYQHDIDRLTTTADEVLARHASAKAALIEWFETLSAYIRVKHGLGDALHSAAAQDLISASWAPATAAVAKLVDACVAEGTIAPGHDPADIIMLMSFLWRVANNDDGVAQGQRLIAAVFSGLKEAPQPT
jgi:AcrR family transcriptional regulator